MSSLNAAPMNGIGGDSPIYLGQYFDGGRCELSLPRATNHSILMVGTSGSGKTHAIRKFAGSYNERGITNLMIDTQGDLADHPELTGHGYIKHEFRYGQGGVTINPIRVEPHGEAGPFVALEDAVDIIRMLKPSLGEQQEADLRRVIRMVYDKAGFDKDDRTTWNRPSPTWDDLCTLTDELYIYALDKNLPDILKSLKALRRAILDDKDSRPQQEKLLETAMTNLARMRDDEAELDHIWEARRLAGLRTVFKTMQESGLFGADSLKIRPGMCNIIDVSKLRATHIQVMIHLLLDRTFYTAVRLSTPDTLNPSIPRFIVTLDEIKHAVYGAKNALSPFNRIVTEGRKYGLGIVAGAQGFYQLNEEVLQNFASQIVLKTDSRTWPEIERNMRVSKTMLKSIEAKRDGIVKLNEGDSRPVHLFA